MMKRLFQILFLGLICWLGYQLLYKPPQQVAMEEALREQSSSKTFTEGFENADTFKDLFPPDWTRWHEISLQNSKSSIRRPIKYCMLNMAECLTSESLGNYIAIENGLRRRGKNSLKFHAEAFDKTWFGDSRAAIRRHLFDYKKGDEIYFTGWFYFEGPENKTRSELHNLNQSMFLAFRSAHEGVRTFGEPGPGLFFDFRNSIGLQYDNWLPAIDNVEQDILNRLHLPLNEWVEIKVKMKLSDKKSEGFVEIWMNDQKIISEPSQTLPTSDMTYSILEVGVVSNLNQKESQTMYVDNITVSPNRFND